MLPELLRVVDLELDLDVVPDRESPDEGLDCGREAELAESLRLEVVAERTQLTARVARELEASGQELVGPLALSAPKSRERSVHDLRDRREMLHRAVVQELSESPALLLLGENPFGETRALGVVGQSIIASRSAMATAWVRVSASSLARM